MKKGWETRRRNEAARREREAAAFAPQRASQQVEQDSVDDELDRALASLASRDKPNVNFGHVYTTAVSVIALALLIEVIVG